LSLVICERQKTRDERQRLKGEKWDKK